jgi:glucose-6-phosphate 1-dehydrogenase
VNNDTPLDPAIITIFGITGDLANRYLLPALYDLAKAGLMPAHFLIVGITRRGTTTEEVLNNLRHQLEAKGKACDEPTLRRLAERISIITMDLTSQAEYERLKAELDSFEDEQGMCLNRIFYLSIPAQTFGPVVDMLGKAQLNTGCQHGRTDSRLLVEKPFGFDLVSAEELVKRLAVHFKEEQVYRIDHFLAKETAQNILTFRLYNPLFKAVWDRRAIDCIAITAAEKISIEGRAAFYEQTGALRDVLQNHLLQLLTLVTMELPKAPSAKAIHQRKQALLKAVEIIPLDEVKKHAVRGQYRDYTKEVDNADSTIETFAAVRLCIANDRWRGVPMLLTTGKALAEKTTEIRIIFKDHEGLKHITNTLIIRIQPNEGIALELLAKKPGFEDKTQTVHMDFSYSRSFAGSSHPDAYEHLLADAIQGDRTLFTTGEEVLAAWRIIEPILHSWNLDSKDLEIYEPGSWGPAGAAALATRAGAKWPPTYN